ncbi:golgin subfamily A member 1-like isoform X2 [Mercenaria mercenaria]|uniref:golgin subfamily A member 1-like isoform X2 n=1 Tax=Mercenaria mercenaria TaxID=6596 RepID=UPI00234ED354|nr:golgin subfamily A member 1-like isoform X2 [Mercenaria mercenaria]
MFAKLKEKIQKEGGNVSEGEKTLSPLPGHASPRRVSLVSTSNGNPAQSPVSKEKVGESLTFSRSTDDLLRTDFSSKEEVLAALQKRTEQCKKLEAKNSEYVTAMKDNAKKIEKLEGYIEKQQDVLAKRTQELNDQYQASRVKMLNELEQKEKKKQELLEKLKQTENMTEKYYKNEEEKEEIQQFTTQEMGKLKHMLILKEEELAKCQNELQEVQKKNKELLSLEDKVKSVESDKCKLEEEVTGHRKIVSALTKERITLEESLNEVKSQLLEKSSAFSSLQAKFAELEGEHQTLVHNSDQQKHKLNQQIQEQKDEIEQLNERLSLLQQREQDKTLSGDDRLVAIEKERDGLERKLTETREQLSQIKSSWSEKISHLEDQIDNLKQKLKVAEQEVQEQVDLLSRKEARFKKERLELETEVSKMKLEKIDLDTHLRAKLTSVESELMALEISKAQEKSKLEDAVAKHEHTISELENKLVKSEEQVKGLEDKLTKLEAEMKDLQSTTKSVQEELGHKEKQLSEAKAHAHSLQEEVILTQEKLDKALHSSKSKITELQESNKDKDDFMLRNAELSQQLTTLQQTLQDEKRLLEVEVEAHREKESELSIKCQELETRVVELTDFQSDHHASNDQVIQLEDTVSALEEQLAEKNKALKKQEQRLNDLKKTLQRELKVQSLPNDEPLDPKVAALTPPLPRKNSLTQKTHNSEHPTRTRRISSHERSPIPGETVMDSIDGINVSLGTQDFFVGDSLQHKSNSDRIPYSVLNSHATISVSDSRGSASHHGAYSSHSGHGRIREFETRHLEKDINFQYLKHVVMKFMLSREHEALQLIKAVSLLLRFTPEEQKLIRDTLEWKMSWFGGSQPPAVLKGQTSKIVPPSW